ncbi:hypothetical protein Glove_208g106 [Diversispora epigaea]|uniref:ATPase domain-containing protein n=1 Tax=Diversispora epigaea TaxID=1348612 RepID=A0A397IST8_9GLOM|nr:hypothetical protein Glove_208g106 [Diversispora epigaea]
MSRYFFRLRPTTNLMISNHRHPEYSFFHQTKKCQFSILTLLKTLTNPLTLLLENLDKPKKTIQEIKVQALETYEKFNHPSTHAFNKTPNFVGREKEKIVIEEILSNNFKWIVVSGAERVGKTALLREILSDDKYNVIHFDLRVPGFANLHSFVTEFSYRIETFLLRFSEDQQIDKEHAKVLEDQAIGIKRFRLEGPESYEKKNQNHGQHKESCRNELTKLLEKFHASLLKYHSLKLKKDKIHKQIPVIFIDEAHKLRNLINDDEALQILFDAMVVFTTQDKLCQVIHSTSDNFYERFLTKSNLSNHIKFLVIGDLNYSNISHIFYQDLLPSVPKEFRENLVRMEDDLCKIFGGSIVDWQNFVQDYKISCGNLTIDDFEPLYRVKNQFVTLFLGSEIPINSIKLISLFQRIVSTPLHCIGYHYACNEFTQYIIDKLIEERILKYKLVDEIGEIVHNEVERPYVMPSSMMTLHVMKLMIQGKQDKKDKNWKLDDFEPLYRVKNQFVTLFLGSEIPINSIKLISLFQRIVSTPLHCIGYHYACNEFTQYIIDKLIEERILKYKLVDEIGEIVHNEVERPYVMPSSMMTLHVMKLMIQGKQDKKDKNWKRN